MVHAMTGERGCGVQISVIVPCHDDGRFLPELCHSVAAATQHDHEVIIIDDGSTDPATRQILKDLGPESASQSIRIVRREHSGLPSSRNAGVALASAPYVQFLDADDLLLPDKIDRQLSIATESILDLIVVDDYIECDEEALTFLHPSPSTIQGFELDFETFALAWERGLSIPIHCALFPRSVLTSSPFTAHLNAKEDWVFWMALASKGAAFVKSGRAGAVYRKHLGNMTRDTRAMGVAWLEAVATAQEVVPGFNNRHLEQSLAHFREFYLAEALQRGRGLFAVEFYTALISSAGSDR